MKMQKLKSTKQHGFTLIESLISLVIFSITVLGSGLTISKMLKVQKEMNIDYIVINEMQNKLQIAMQTSTSTAPTSLCASPSLTSNINVAAQTFYVSCATEKIEIGDTITEWPILAASTHQATANACAQGNSSESCFIVGR